MAEARIGYRGNAVGISAGLGIALPLAAYAVSLPFDGVSEVVRADAMPFAAGIVAGVGMLALTGHLLDVHADRVAAEEAEAARFSSMYETGVINRGASNSHSQTSSAPRGKRFARKGTPAGVPVISRAVDALDEMEAWAEIDAMFKDGSPISCDPTRSKDMYQIALEELRRSERAAAAATPVTAAAAIAATAATAATAAVRVTTPVPQAANAGGSFVDDFDLDEADARDEAMASLYGPSVVSRSHAPVLPTMSAPVVQSAVPVRTVQASSPAQQVRSQEAPSVPVADYSGHEGMWAAALAILADESVSALTSVSSTPAVAEPAATSVMDARRMAAIAEGSHATRLHSHVNSIIEEEFDKVPSKSVHRTAHEYLKVIEGGTAGMPALQSAEG